GTVRTTSAGPAPAPRPPASTVAMTASTPSVASVAVGPATSTLTVAGSVSATRPGPTPSVCTATTGNGRVPDSWITVTPTVASVGWSRETPGGSRSGTRNDAFTVSPLTSTSAVSTRSIAAILSGVAWTCT